MDKSEASSAGQVASPTQLNMNPDAELYAKINVHQQRENDWALKEYGHHLTWSETAKERILDLGCGVGDVTKAILKNAVPQGRTKIIGVDKAENMIKYAQLHNADPDIRYAVADAMDLASILPTVLEGDKVDKVFSFFFLHWIKKVKVSTVVWDGWRDMAKKPRWMPYLTDVEETICPFHDEEDQQQSVTKAFTDAGFRVKKCDVIKRDVVFPSAEAVKMLAKSVDPWLSHRIPKTDHDAYLTDLANVMIARLTKRPNNTYYCQYSVAVVVAENVTSPTETNSVAPSSPQVVSAAKAPEEVSKIETGAPENISTVKKGALEVVPTVKKGALEEVYNVKKGAGIPEVISKAKKGSIEDVSKATKSTVNPNPDVRTGERGGFDEASSPSGRDGNTKYNQEVPVRTSTSQGTPGRALKHGLERGGDGGSVDPKATGTPGTASEPHPLQQAQFLLGLRPVSPNTNENTSRKESRQNVEKGQSNALNRAGAQGSQAQDSQSIQETQSGTSDPGIQPEGPLKKEQPNPGERGSVEMRSPVSGSPGQNSQ